MATLFDSASLVMIPSGYKDDKLYSIKPTDGSGDFTFSRDGAGASPATRVNASGLIEKGRENLILHSADWTNSAWNKTNVSVSADATTNPINGSTTADSILETTGNGQHNFFQLIGSYSAGAVITTSFYAKANGRTKLRMNDGSSAIAAVFDLSAETAVMANGNGIPIITSVGDGWYRCSLFFLSSGGNEYIAMNFRNDLDEDSYTGDVTQGMYFFGAQAELGLVATDYIETTTAPVSAGLLGDMPRLDYSGGATCPSLLLEPSRVNVITSSEHLGSYSVSNVSVSYNNATSPEGVQNATLVTGDVGTLTKVVNFNPAIIGAYTISVFAKYNTQQWIQLGMGGIATYANFDIQNGVKGNTNGTSDIEDYGDGWYRCSVQMTSGTPLSHYIGIVDGSSSARLSTSSSTGSFWAYGMQSEIGSYPTSYIPTYGSASTRGDDDCSKTGVASLIGDTEGTIFLEGAYNRAASGNNVFFELINSPNQLVLYMDSTTNELKLYNSENPTNRLTLSSGDNRGVNHKIALAYKDNDFAIYLDGVAQSVTGTNLVPTGMANIYVGQNRTGGEVGQSIYKQILLFKTRLTNAELAALTA